MSVNPSTPADRAALADAMNDLRREWGYDSRVTVNHLLGRWEVFVHEVQDGYALTLADYTKELALRDSLEELKSRLAGRLRDQIEEVLGAADERFRFATKQTQQPLLPADPPIRFWWFRLPNVLHGELLENVLAENLI